MMIVTALPGCKLQKHATVRKNPQGEKYKELLRNLKDSGLLITTRDSTEKAVNEALIVGRRNIIYLDRINAEREQQNNHPITFSNNFSNNSGNYKDPFIYGSREIKTKIDQLKKELPESLHAIFFSQDNFFNAPIDNINLFIKWSRVIDSISQHAVRWRTVIYHHKKHYKSQAKKDLRSYLYLKNYPRNNFGRNLSYDLKNYDFINAKTKQTLKSALLDLCQKNNGKRYCNRKFKRALNRDDLPQFYQKHYSKITKTYDSFFEIDKTSHLARWNDNTLEIMFQNNNTYFNLLKDSVATKWKTQWGSIKLIPSNSSLDPKIIDKDQIIPSVNKARNTLNWSRDIVGNEARNVMAHEFGHILGFKDCYVEFINEDQNMATFYFIENDDIMCNSSGIVSKKHFDQLKKAFQ